MEGKRVGTFLKPCLEAIRADVSLVHREGR